MRVPRNSLVLMRIGCRPSWSRPFLLQSTNANGEPKASTSRSIRRSDKTFSNCKVVDTASFAAIDWQPITQSERPGSHHGHHSNQSSSMPMIIRMMGIARLLALRVARDQGVR
jgi:hypothetical protein